MVSFFVQAEDGIGDLVRSRGIGDVYKRQAPGRVQRAPRRVGRWRETHAAGEIARPPAVGEISWARGAPLVDHVKTQPSDSL